MDQQQPFYIWSGDESNDYFYKEEIEIEIKTFFSFKDLLTTLKENQKFDFLKTNPVLYILFNIHN